MAPVPGGREKTGKGARMKLIVASILSIAFGTALAADASAAQRKPYKHYGNSGYARVYSYQAPSRQTAYNGEPSYYEHLPDKVPFGSRLWWRIQEERNIGR
jgi:hypothetical protein